MTEHLTTDPGYRLEYIVGDETWYAATNRAVDPDPYLNIIKAAEGGGCAWEFTVVDRSSVQPRVGHPVEDL